MKIITDEMFEMIGKMAKHNPALNYAIRKSNEETFNFSIYQNNRYKEMLEECTLKLTEKMQNKFNDHGKDYNYGIFASGIIPELIVSMMPEQTHILFEVIQDGDFNNNAYVDYEMPSDDLSIHVRSFINECMRDDLNDLIDGIWEEIVEKSERE